MLFWICIYYNGLGKDVGATEFEYWNYESDRKLAELKRVLRDDHPDTLTCMATLAFILKVQGSISRAISLIEGCCELQSSPRTPTSIYYTISQNPHHIAATGYRN